LEANSQDVYDYKNQEYFNGKGKVFTAKYDLTFLIPDMSQRFTPTNKEVVLAEQILSERYHKDLQDVNWDTSKINVYKKYKKYNRQYLAYESKEGSRYIIINLLNFKCKKKANKEFEGWEEMFFIGLGDYYEENQIKFKINLTEEKLSLY